VAVGIRLHDGQQLRLRGGQSTEKAVIFFKETGLNFNPAGAYCSQGIHTSVYRANAEKELAS
jgi:tRNA(His) 5'-end guanylyltransferase